MQITRDKLQNARLSPAEIPGLRARIRSGMTTTSFEADRYGVGVETIRRAVRGETFRNVRDGLDDSEVRPNGPPLNIPEETVAESVRRLQEMVEADESPVDTFLTARKDLIEGGGTDAQADAAARGEHDSMIEEYDTSPENDSRKETK